MAAIRFDGEDDPRFHQPAADPAPAQASSGSPFTPPARPEGGRDDSGNYIPNPVVPGAPDYYWDGDQQLPIPHGATPTPTTNNTNGGNSGGNSGAWDSAAAERAIRDQYQRLGGR